VIFARLDVRNSAMSLVMSTAISSYRTATTIRPLRHR
jgi:hypothetical protein